MQGRGNTETASPRAIRDIVLWSAAGVIALALSGWAFRQVFPLMPDGASINREEAVEIALERFRELGDPVADPYVVAEMINDTALELRIRNHGVDGETKAELGRRVVLWRVSVYPPGKRYEEWAYRALVGTGGEVIALRAGGDDDTDSGEVEADDARRQADELLGQAGFDLRKFDEPELRRTDQTTRVDTVVRYRDRSERLGPEIPYGVEVVFSGDRMAGFRPWVEDPNTEVILAQLQSTTLLSVFRIIIPYVLFPFVAFFFLRRYHAGEIGVKRAVQVFALVFVSGAIMMAMIGRPATEEISFGPLSRRLTTWAWSGQFVVLWVAPVALLAAISWSVGEVGCRRRWPSKLAAFDALFKRDWRNTTVARSSLRGLAAAAVLGVALLLLTRALEPLGVRALHASVFDLWWQHAAWAGVAMLLQKILLSSYAELFGRLFLVPAAVNRLGRIVGVVAVAVLTGIVFWPNVIALPVGWGLLLGIINSAALVGLFLAYDLWTVLLASAGSSVLISSLPLLLSTDGFLRLQGGIPLVVLCLPLLVSFPHLLRGSEFVYRWDDIPPHVRRIAERERQRVELETARRIQTSILPDLPPRLAGVDLAHAYLPASEVGGDFYDVMALEDGRLAVAVGDVAGHGVSSGLVMSVAKSALTVQVTFDPDVVAVFQSLNRMVYQAARMRLLTTLCYALIDADRRHLSYACAGHINPYRLTPGGEVLALDSIAYPLGVRDTIEVSPREMDLASGDRIVLFSDGVVEALRDGTEEPFGFGRLEDSLRRRAGQTPEQILNGLLSEVDAFCRSPHRDDDRTVLVLGIP